MNIAASIFFIIIAYSFINWIYIKYCNKNLSIDVNFDRESTVEGDTIHIKEIVINKKILPLPVLMIKFSLNRCLRFTDTSDSISEDEEIFDDGKNSAVTDLVYRNDIISIGAYQKKVRTLPLKCVSRGYCSINSIYTIGSDLFLKNKIDHIYPVFKELYIYPKSIDDRNFDNFFNSMMGDFIVKRYINEDPFEFKGIRDYQSFDPLKNVNWKASARSMDLKVNQTDATANFQITLLLNMTSPGGLKDEEVDENTIRLAATFAHKFQTMGIPVAFSTNGCDCISKQPISLPHGSSAEHTNAILMGLSRIDVYKNKPLDFTQTLHEAISSGKEHTYYLIISQVVNKKMAQLITPLMDNTKIIVAQRIDNKVPIPGYFQQCCIPWINEY